MNTILPASLPVIETSHLCKGRGQHMQVHDLNIQIPPRCVYGLLGPEGSGKTTTLKLILGLAKPTSGNIMYSGEELTDRNKRIILKSTGNLIGDPVFYKHLTGAENLEILARLKGLSAGQVMKALHKVYLYNEKDTPVKDYTSDMRKRLGIASAILGNPKILILDEPVKDLDPAGTQRFFDFIKSLPAKHGTTVIVTSSLPDELKQMAEYAGVLDHGELIYQGVADYLYGIH